MTLNHSFSYLMQKPIRYSLTAAACLLAFSAHAQFISHLYSIGDSLTDAGTYAPTTQLFVPGSGRFTTNPGLVWTQYLGRALGLSSEAAIVNQFGAPTRTPNGGTNYSQGGSRVLLTPGVGVDAGVWFTADPVSSQVDRLLADTGGRIDGKALVTVWAGANDIFAQYGAVGLGLPVPSALAGVGTSASDLNAQIMRLQAAGAKLILVNTLPDLGVTPFGLSQGPAGAGLLTAMSDTFNQQLLQATAGRNVLVFDTNRVLNDVRARPAAYGFTALNAATQPACLPPGSSSLLCVNPAGADTYVFADGVHPTSATHKIFAQVTLASMRAAGQNGTLAVAPLVAIRQHAQTLEGRLTSGALVVDQPDDSKIVLRPKGHLEMYTALESGRFGASTRGVRLGNEAKTNVVLVGGDITLAPHALAGLVLSHAEGDLSFSENTGGFKSRLTTVGTYATVALSPEWYLNAALAYGDLDFDNIHRDARLGSTQLLVSSTGQTTGSYASARVGGGYILKAGRFFGGPTLSLTEERVKVKAYTEAPGPLAFSFGDTTYRSRRVSLGFNGTYDIGRIKPFARVSLEKDLNHDPLRVTMGSYASNAITVDGDRPDGQFALATLGVKGSLGGGMQWNLLYSTTLSQSNIRGWSVGAALQVPF